MGLELFIPRLEKPNKKKNYYLTAVYNNTLVPNNRKIFTKIHKPLYTKQIYNFLTQVSKLLEICLATFAFLIKANSKYCLNAGLDQSPSNCTAVSDKPSSKANIAAPLRKLCKL